MDRRFQQDVDAGHTDERARMCLGIPVLLAERTRVVGDEGSRLQDDPDAVGGLPQTPGAANPRRLRRTNRLATSSLSRSNTSRFLRFPVASLCRSIHLLGLPRKALQGLE